MKKKSLSKPTFKIDLHGMTVQEAFEHCREQLAYYSISGHKSVEVITGRSGQIRKEFPNWLDTLKYSGTVAWHDGSFTVNLK